MSNYPNLDKIGHKSLDGYRVECLTPSNRVEDAKIDFMMGLEAKLTFDDYIRLGLEFGLTDELKAWDRAVGDQEEAEQERLRDCGPYSYDESVVA